MTLEIGYCQSKEQIYPLAVSEGGALLASPLITSDSYIKSVSDVLNGLHFLLRLTFYVKILNLCFLNLCLFFAY